MKMNNETNVDFKRFSRKFIPTLEFFSRDFKWDTIHDEESSLRESAQLLLASGFEDTISLSSESDTVRSYGSWDLPSGPIPWEDKDKSFEQILRYSDLVLTEEEENGVLTDRIIAACAEYLTRMPASKGYITAKLCLDNKNLTDIRILGFHRFLQYVDLSGNNIDDLSPLGNLPYLVYLDVSHNLLEDVLQFQPPWNLTYVNYSYNKVCEIDDLSDFWSLVYLDLSHNKITNIQGLESLRYLRYLNLSHNNISKFENLNHTRITDLNLEHNIISSFEMGEEVGMKTLLNISSLCLNNNHITNLDFLEGVYHLRKLELRENLISNLLCLSYMQTLRKLEMLDLLGNPVCVHKPYRQILLNILPEIRFLDQTEVHSSEKVAAFVRKILMIPLRAEESNGRMTILDQLNDEILDLSVIPIDQGAYPLVILVGPSASGKKTLISKLVAKYPDKLFVGKLHTTREILEEEKALLITLSREEFHEKIKMGHFYCVMEKLGQFTGFSKEIMALAVKSHKLCLTFMSLEGALTILARGIEAHLVLTIPSSEQVHRMRLRKMYGPVMTLMGAVYVAKRELLNTRASNIRRVRDILLDIIEEVIYWKEERRHIRLISTSDIDKNFKTYESKDKFSLDSWKENEVRVENKMEFLKKKCSLTTCGLQEEFKEVVDANQEVTDFSFNTDNTKNSFDYEMRDEDSGTCTTSYSTLIPPPMMKNNCIFDEEGSFGGEDDIFADWTSPFIDWDELNIDSKAVEEVGEKLSQKFAERVLANRAIYENIHTDNPGLFLRVFFTDNEDETAKDLAKFLREVWLSAPNKKPIDIEKDYAYQQMIPKRLQKLKGMIREEKCFTCDKDNENIYVGIRSPRTIVSKMQLAGYGIPGEKD